MSVYNGRVYRWMPERGYGFIKCTTLPTDVLVHFSAIGGGNLIVGEYVDFELDSAKTLKAKRIIGMKGVNKLWIDVDGKQVDWSIGYTRELARIRHTECLAAGLRSRQSFIDTKYLTDPADDQCAFKNMLVGRQARETELRATLPRGATLNPETLEVTFNNNNNNNINNNKQQQLNKSQQRGGRVGRRSRSRSPRSNRDRKTVKQNENRPRH